MRALTGGVSLSRVRMCVRILSRASASRARKAWNARPARERRGTRTCARKAWNAHMCALPHAFNSRSRVRRVPRAKRRSPRRPRERADRGRSSGSPACVLARETAPIARRRGNEWIACDPLCGRVSALTRERSGSYTRSPSPSGAVGLRRAQRKKNFCGLTRPFRGQSEKVLSLG